MAATLIGQGGAAEIAWEKPLRLCYEVPAYPRGAKPSAEDAALIARGEARLRYHGRVYDRSSWDPERRIFTAGWDGAVDAQTGRFVNFGFGSAGIPRPAATPFSWPTPAPGMVFSKTRRKKLMRAGIDSVSQPGGLGDGRPVAVMIGKRVLALTFYPEARLLAFGEGEARRFGRPNAELLSALTTLAIAAKSEASRTR